MVGGVSHSVFRAVRASDLLCDILGHNQRCHLRATLVAKRGDGYRIDGLALKIRVEHTNSVRELHMRGKKIKQQTGKDFT